MGEHLHGFLVGQKILQVVLDEDAHPLLGIVHPFQALTQALQNGGERVFLDQIKQLFFRIKVVVQPGQGHAAGARKVAHGSAFVALLAEHLGSMLQDLGQTAVETAALHGWNPGRTAGKRTGTSRGSHAELEPPPLGAYRTFVLYHTAGLHPMQVGLCDSQTRGLRAEQSPGATARSAPPLRTPRRGVMLRAFRPEASRVQCRDLSRRQGRQSPRYKAAKALRVTGTGALLSPTPIARSR